MTDKIALRRAMRALRADRRGGPIHVDAAFRARMKARPTVAGYIAVGGEADPTPLLDAAIAAGCPLALPHVVDRATPLRFLRWAVGDALVEGPFGLRQPLAESPPCEPDVILTPLVAFDGLGNRLGQGAGHYDRAFAAHPSAWRVGVAWEIQRVERLVPDPWDVPLHAIATDLNWIVP